MDFEETKPHGVGSDVVTNVEDDRALKRELLDGIRSREAAIHSLKVRYTVTEEYTPRYREDWGEQMAQKHSLPWMRWLAKIRARKMPLGTSIGHYELIAKDGLCAYSRLKDLSRFYPQCRTSGRESFAVLDDGRPGDRGPAWWAERLWVLGIDGRLCAELSTLYRQGNICFSDLPDFEQFFELEASKVSRLASPAGTEDTVYRVGISVPQEQFGDERSSVVEHTVDVNASKSYWPVGCEMNYVHPAHQGLPETRDISRQVVLSDFRDCDGVAFPRKLVARDFDSRGRIDPKTGEWSPINGETRINTIVVEEIAMNVPVDDPAFVSESPQGARFVDLDGRTYRVMEDVM
jgi:hypothetical protein